MKLHKKRRLPDDKQPEVITAVVTVERAALEKFHSIPAHLETLIGHFKQSATLINAQDQDQEFKDTFVNCLDAIKDICATLSNGLKITENQSEELENQLDVRELLTMVTPASIAASTPGLVPALTPAIDDFTFGAGLVADSLDDAFKERSASRNSLAPR